MKIVLLLVSSLCFVTCAAIESQAQSSNDVQVVVYGATPSGIAAAVGAARDGCTVLLVEPTARIGGLITSGLSHTDYHSRESLSGAFLEFAERVEQYYVEKYGEDSPQHKDSYHGVFAEPKVNLLVFEQMLAEYPAIRIERDWQIESVQTDVSSITKSASVPPATRRIVSVTFNSASSGNTRSQPTCSSTPVTKAISWHWQTCRGVADVRDEPKPMSLWHRLNQITSCKLITFASS